MVSYSIDVLTPLPLNRDVGDDSTLLLSNLLMNTFLLM